MGIQAVFFDMGGTLETFSFTRELRMKATPDLQRLLRSAGIDLHLSDKKCYEVVSAGLDRYHKWSLESLAELPVKKVWSDFILAGYPLDAHSLAAAAENLMYFLETRYYQREMRPEVPVVLEKIKKMGLKIGLISNVNSQFQVPLSLQRYGIKQYFNPVVLSSTYGRRKPDPAIFHHAARLAQVPTSQCVYVGDRIARDIVGARKAGYRMAIQIHHDYEHGELDEGATPDAVISQMTELVDILQMELDHSDPGAGSGRQKKRQIQALLFDAGDILYHRPRFGERMTAFLKELGLEDKHLTSASKRTLKYQAFQGLIDQDQYWEGVLRLYGITRSDHIQRGKQILEAEDNDIDFFAGVSETLHALKKDGYMLGIITDTSSPLYIKLGWLERGGFGEVWDSIISSKELGTLKPDPRIYRAALQQLGISADQAVFVGHKPSDLSGAQEVGIKTVAFNYDEKAKADYYIEHFADLLKMPVIG